MYTVHYVESEQMLVISGEGKIRNIQFGSPPSFENLTELAKFIAMIEAGAYERGSDAMYNSMHDARNEES